LKHLETAIQKRQIYEDLHRHRFSRRGITAKRNEFLGIGFEENWKKTFPATNLSSGMGGEQLGEYKGHLPQTFLQKQLQPMKHHTGFMVIMFQGQDWSHHPTILPVCLCTFSPKKDATNTPSQSWSCVFFGGLMAPCRC